MTSAIIVIGLLTLVLTILCAVAVAVATNQKSAREAAEAALNPHEISAIQNECYAGMLVALAFVFWILFVVLLFIG